MPVSITYFCPTKSTGREQVKRVIRLVVTEDNFEVFTRWGDFEKHLRTHVPARHIVVFHAGSKKHLQQIAALQNLLMDHKIVLILPDAKPETIELAHTVRPRFITYADSDFLDMASVLRRMLLTCPAETDTAAQTSWTLKEG